MKPLPPTPTRKEDRETRLEKLLNQIDRTGQFFFNGFWLLIYKTIQAGFSTIVITTIIKLLGLFTDNQYLGFEDCSKFSFLETKFYICNFFVISDFALWLTLIAIVTIDFFKTIWIIFKKNFTSKARY